MFGGDDSVIKRSIGMIWVLAFITIALLIIFGIIQFGNGYFHKSDLRVCTYTFKSVVAFDSFRINEPLLPPSCHYEH